MQQEMTLIRHIMHGQSKHPEAKGNFSNILNQIALAAKIIGSRVNMAGITHLLGLAGDKNIHGESQQKLDVFADAVFYDVLDHTGLIAGMVSEEDVDIKQIPEKYDVGDYVITYDPLDGSSNIDANVSIGTIFGIFKRISTGDRAIESDFLQAGRKLEGAGYAIYGSSTMLVYSAGHGVHGFTLDPAIGEFILSHENIQMPDKCKNLSVNESNKMNWDKWTHKYVEDLIGRNTETERFISSRYIGSLVADFHRNLLKGGVFLYPADKRQKEGRLRLLYEAQPLAFLAEEAGGKASDGFKNILDIEPKGLHQRTPLIIGNTAEVEMAEEYVKKYSQAQKEEE
ncbi:MAG: class 1 fructose-bisphosphatase [Acidobacteria bacterium]|nr:class 1 fructose-bisphosphatase [Acidobacteriota bacterium]